jgi:hypothetical protein
MKFGSRVGSEGMGYFECEESLQDSIRDDAALADESRWRLQGDRHWHHWCELHYAADYASCQFKWNCMALIDLTFLRIWLMRVSDCRGNVTCEPVFKGKMTNIFSFKSRLV